MRVRNFTFLACCIFICPGVRFSHNCDCIEEAGQVSHSKTVIVITTRQSLSVFLAKDDLFKDSNRSAAAEELIDYFEAEKDESTRKKAYYAESI